MTFGLGNKPCAPRSTNGFVSTSHSRGYRDQNLILPRRAMVSQLRMSRDLYETLGIPRGSDARVIKRAFREKARKWHPDVNDSPDAEAKFQEISQAYATLSDPEKKARYDQFGDAGIGMGGGTGGAGVEVNLEDIFDSFFGGGVGGSRSGGFSGQARTRSGPIQGDDLRADLELDFRTACFGGRERVRITHLEKCTRCSGSGVKPGAKVRTCSTCNGAGVVMQVTRTPLGNFQTQTVCPDCRGSGQSVDELCSTCGGQGVQRKSKQVSVNIPCGVDTGNKLRVAGEGDAGLRGGAAGDLYIFLNVKSDGKFKRNGVDIYSELDVSVVDAILGGSRETETLDEDALEVIIPPGTQPGTKLRLKGKGVPGLSKPSQRGTLFVTINVKIPTGLSDEETELVEKLKALQGY